MLAGQQVQHPAGPATALPTFDFETYSEAGFVWNEVRQKWEGPDGAPGTKRGLPVVGLKNYVNHPSFEILCLSYDLLDGAGMRTWSPGRTRPADLFDHVNLGELLEAWNVNFELTVWTDYCVPVLGWPAIRPEQVVCAMAKSRAHAMPGALANAGDVLQTVHRKDKDGDRLLKLFSVPRNPTKKNPALRLMPEAEPEDGAKLLDYNRKDVLAEIEISLRIPDLSATERRYWEVDQAINRRGLPVDMAAVDNCIAIVEQAVNQGSAELRRITGGEVSEASEVTKMLKWLHARGLHLDNLQEETLDAALAKKPAGHDPCYRVLEIRQAIGSAAVKKLYSFKLQSYRGRAHDLYSYFGARTGRWTANGPQPQNMYKGRFDTIEEVETALNIIALGSLEALESIYGEGQAIDVVASCLRSLIATKPGFDLVCSDFSAIESVVTACLAGEQWRIDVFRTHGMIYEASASRTCKIPLEEFIRHKKETGKHHPMRNAIGKFTELACFSPQTQVLTDRGYVAIVDVTVTDKLWDGVEWVKHNGVIAKGVKQVIALDGIKMTPDHQISCGRFWREAKTLASNRNMLRQALAYGSENLPYLDAVPAATTGTYWFNVLAAQSLMEWLFRVSEKVLVLGAIPALRKSLKRHIENLSGATRIRCLMTRIAAGLSTAFRLQLDGATIQKVGNLNTTDFGGCKYAQNGAKTSGHSFATFRHLKGGTLLAWRWTASTWTAIMRRAMYGLLPDRRTPLTNDGLPTWSPVFDILNSGLRSRFTIKTDSGHLIVHNCGFGGWIGALIRFGADEFLSEDEMKRAILDWRAASPTLPLLWGGQTIGERWSKQPCLYGLEGAIISAIKYPGTAFSYRAITYQVENDVLYCRVPSGGLITYHSPRLTPHKRFDWSPDWEVAISYMGWNNNPMMGEMGWVRMDLYGGKATENVVQRVARDIQAEAMCAVEAAEYPVVLHSHDELCAEMPIGKGSVEEFERIVNEMVASLPWAKCDDGTPWPIKMKGGWRKTRYGKWE